MWDAVRHMICSKIRQKNFFLLSTKTKNETLLSLLLLFLFAYSYLCAKIIFFYIIRFAFAFQNKLAVTFLFIAVEFFYLFSVFFRNNFFLFRIISFGSRKIEMKFEFWSSLEAFSTNSIAKIKNVT